MEAVNKELNTLFFFRGQIVWRRLTEGQHEKIRMSGTKGIKSSESQQETARGSAVVSCAVRCARLSDGLAAVRVDPERSRLDGLLGVDLGDGPLHLVHQSPARCGGSQTTRQPSAEVRSSSVGRARSSSEEIVQRRLCETLTSTSHVLSRSRRHGSAQQETQSHAGREQRSRFSHLAPGGKDSSHTHTLTPSLRRNK